MDKGSSRVTGVQETVRDRQDGRHTDEENTRKVTGPESFVKKLHTKYVNDIKRPHH